METRSVLLALIGQEWLDLRDSQGGRRLDDANDFVRIELASALRRDTPVVPVLVRGRSCPTWSSFPKIGGTFFSPRLTRSAVSETVLNGRITNK
jgi:hypothetical protein